MSMNGETNVMIHGRGIALLAAVAVPCLFSLVYVVYLMLIDG